MIASCTWGQKTKSDCRRASFFSESETLIKMWVSKSEVQGTKRFHIPRGPSQATSKDWSPVDVSQHQEPPKS